MRCRMPAPGLTPVPPLLLVPVPALFARAGREGSIEAGRAFA